MYVSIFLDKNNFNYDLLRAILIQNLVVRRVANGLIVELREAEPLDVVFEGAETHSSTKVVDYEIPNCLLRIGQARLVVFEAGGGISRKNDKLFRGSAQVVAGINGEKLHSFYRSLKQSETHAHFFATEIQNPMVLVRSDWSRYHHELGLKIVEMRRAKKYARVTISKIFECSWYPGNESYGLDLPPNFACFTPSAVAAIDKSLCPGCNGTHYPHEPHSRAKT